MHVQPKVKNFITYIGVYGGFFLWVEWMTRTNRVSPTLLPSPTQLFEIFIQQFPAFQQAFFQTFWMSAAAFVLSSALAFSFAVGLNQLKTVQKQIAPLVVFLQTVPIIAIAPLLVIYLGFGIPTILSAAFIVCFFPVYSATRIGLDLASDSQNELFAIMKASFWQRLKHLQIPTCIPHLLAGLRSSAGLSVVGVVAGEFVAGGGLGALIDSARLQQRVDIVFCCLILLSLIGLALVYFTDLVFTLLFKKYFVRL